MSSEPRCSLKHPPEDPYGLDEQHGPLDSPDHLARLWVRLKRHGMEPVSTVRFLERRHSEPYRSEMAAMLSEEERTDG